MDALRRCREAVDTLSIPWVKKVEGEDGERKARSWQGASEQLADGW